MAKIDDIKSQQPDSRLTSLGTLFRPGQKRIALPTSKQMSSHAGEVNVHSNSGEDASPLIVYNTHSSSTNFSKISESLIEKTILGTTQHNNSAQLDTITQHNSAHNLDKSDTISVAANKLEVNSILYPAQLGTNTIIQKTPIEFDKSTINEVYLDSISKDTTINLETDQTDLIKQKANLHLGNPAQPGTETRHNSTRLQSTTQHNPIQNRKIKQTYELNPDTTRHNPAPGPAQPNTITRHKNSSEPDFNDYQKKINNLSGTSAQVLSFLCKKCIDNGTNRVTISYKILSELTKVNFNSIPTTCKRLRNSGFFELSGSKGGAQAVRHFDLSDFTIRAFSTELLRPKFPAILSNLPSTTRHNNPAQPDTWADTGAPSMYVGTYNNTIHTEDKDLVTKKQLGPDQWAELREIDFSTIEHFGIKVGVVETLKKNKWVVSRNQLEDHIERFVRYFSEKEFEKRREPIKNPYSFFLGAIKAISKGESDPICDIETQFEIIQKQAIQNKLKAMEVRRREHEFVEKQMEQYRDSEFEHWVKGLGNEEKMQFAPPNKMAELGSGLHKILLRDYFNQNIWSEIKNGILNNNGSEKINVATEK